jgi:hypothetical protein
MTEQTSSTPPVVDAYEVKGSLVVRCPYCQRLHFHGVAGGDGHRGAHCLNDIPSAGYVLRLAGKRETYSEVRRLGQRGAR